jgi:ribosomal protein S14
VTVKHAKCDCDKPTPWEDVKGKKTNMCKVCGGRIEVIRTPEIGRVHTAIDAVLLGELGLDENHPFVMYLASTIKTSIHSTKKTWDHNRAVKR